MQNLTRRWRYKSSSSFLTGSLGIPLCLFAAHLLHWGIIGVYALLTSEELFRLAVTLVMFKKRSWMVSLSR